MDADTQAAVRAAEALLRAGRRPAGPGKGPRLRAAEAIRKLEQARELIEEVYRDVPDDPDGGA